MDGGHFCDGQSFDTCRSNNINRSYSYSADNCGSNRSPSPSYSCNGVGSTGMGNYCSYPSSQHSLPLPSWKPKRNPFQNSTSGKFADHPFRTLKGSAQDTQARPAKVRRPVPPTPSNSSQNKEGVKVEKFLLNNPGFLQTFVNNHVDPKTLKKWSQQKESIFVEKQEIHVASEEATTVSDVKVVEASEPEKSPEMIDEQEVAVEKEEVGVKDVDEKDGEASEVQEIKLELDGLADGTIPENVSKIEESGTSEENGESPNVEAERNAAAAAADPVEPEIMSLQPEESKVTTSTSTIDAMICSLDLSVPSFVSASTSTTDGLVQKPLGPHSPNPKVAQNLAKLMRIREARKRQRECLEGKLRQATNKRHRTKSTHRTEGQGKHGSQGSSKANTVGRSKGEGGHGSKDPTKAAVKGGKALGEGKSPLLGGPTKRERKSPPELKSDAGVIENDESGAIAEKGSNSKPKGCIVNARDASPAGTINDALLDLIVKFHNRKPKQCFEFEEADEDDDEGGGGAGVQDFFGECQCNCAWLHEYCSVLDKGGVQN